MVVVPWGHPPFTYASTSTPKRHQNRPRDSAILMTIFVKIRKYRLFLKGFKPRKEGRKCSDLSEIVRHKLVCLNPQSPVSGTVWGDLGDVTLKHVSRCGLGDFRDDVSRFCFSFSASSLWSKMWTLSLLLPRLYRPPCLLFPLHGGLLALWS